MTEEGNRRERKALFLERQKHLWESCKKTGSSQGAAQREDPKPTGATKSPEEFEVSRAHSNNKPHR